MAKTIKRSNVSLEMLISSRPYKDPKNIAIQYALGEGISILNYSVKSEGLDLSKAIDLKDPTQTINLSLKGDKGCITIIFNERFMVCVGSWRSIALLRSRPSDFTE